jgi:methyl-accepting chemotaxis protein
VGQSITIAELSALIKANAEPLVQEFKRADRQAKEHADSISGQVDHMLEHLERGFSGSRFAHGFLAAVGVGTGAAAVEHMIEKWVDLWKESEEAAKKLQERAESIAKIFENLGKVRFEGFLAGLSPERQLEELKKKQEEIAAKMAEQEARRTAAIADIGTLYNTPRGTISGSAFDPFEGKYGYGHTMKGIGDIAGAAADEAQKKWAELAVEFENNRKKIEEVQKAIEKLHEAEDTKHEKGLESALKEQEKAFDQLVEKQKKANDETQKHREETTKLADKYKEIADPTLKFTTQIDQVNKLLATGAVTADQAARAIANLNNEMSEDKMRRVNAALDNFFSDIDRNEKTFVSQQQRMNEEIERHVGSAASGISASMVDALKGAEGGWRNLKNVVIDQLEQIVLELEVVNPLIRSFGGVFSGLGFDAVGSALSNYGLPKHAAGGYAPAGEPAIFGEEGPEISIPKTSGTVLPAGLTSALMSGRGGGTYYIDARGADRAGIAQLWAALQQVHASIAPIAVGAVVQRNFRSSGFRRAMG